MSKEKKNVPAVDPRDVRVTEEFLSSIADEPAGGSGVGFVITGRIQSMAREILQLRQKHKALREEYFLVSASSRFHEIEQGDFCPECNGSGYKLYGSTATWRGGVGGQAMTTSVCDKCWGSGSKSTPWPSWRKYEELERNSK